MKLPLNHMNKWQKAAFALVTIGCIINIALYATTITFGVEFVAKDIIKDNKCIIEILWGLSTSLTLFFLSKAGRNTATRKVFAVASVICLITALPSVLCNEKPLLYAFSYLIETLTILYMLGVVTRNNTLERKTKCAINIYFVVILFVSEVVNVLCAIFEILPYYKLAEELTALVLLHTIISSNIFNGEKELTPAAKGAYKFWNKYMKIWVIAHLAAIVMLIIGAIYFVALLENAAPLD